MKKPVLFFWLLLLNVKLFAQAPPPPPPPPPPLMDELSARYQLTPYKSLYQTLSFPVNNKLTGRHQRIRGTRIFTRPIQLFEIKNIMFVYKKDPRYFFTMSDRKLPVSRVSDSLENLVYANPIGKIINEKITINGLEGKYLEAIDTINAMSVVFITAGTDTNALFQMYMCDLLDREMVNEYTGIIQSFHFRADYPIDQAENLRFKINAAESGFKVANYIMGGAVFSEDGKHDDNDLFKPNFQIVEMQPMDSKMADQALDKMPAFLSSIMKFSAQFIDIRTKFINDRTVLIREYEITTNNGEKSHYFIAAILEKHMSLVFQGFCKDNHQAYNEKWLKLIESITFL